MNIIEWLIVYFTSALSVPLWLIRNKQILYILICKKAFGSFSSLIMLLNAYCKEAARTIPNNILRFQALKGNDYSGIISTFVISSSSFVFLVPIDSQGICHCLFIGCGRCYVHI